MTLRFREALAVLVGRKVASPAPPRPILPGGDFVGQWRERQQSTYRHYEGRRIGDDPDVARDMISGEVV